MFPPFLLVINHFIYLFIVNVSMLLLGFLPLNANGHIYEMLGLRCASLSAVTKAGAGQDVSNKRLNPNILYMMLAIVIY